MVSTSDRITSPDHTNPRRRPTPEAYAPVVGMLELVGCLPRRLFILTLHRAGEPGMLEGVYIVSIAIAVPRRHFAAVLVVADQHQLSVVFLHAAFVEADDREGIIYGAPFRHEYITTFRASRCETALFATAENNGESFALYASPRSSAGSPENHSTGFTKSPRGTGKPTGGTLFGITPSTKRGKRARRTGHNVSTASDICNCIQVSRDGHQTDVHSRSHNVTQSHHAEMAIHVRGLRRFRAPIQSNPPTMIRSRALDAAIH